MDKLPPRLLNQYINEIFEESPSMFQGIEDMVNADDGQEIVEENGQLQPQIQQARSRG